MNMLSKPLKRMAALAVLGLVLFLVVEGLLDPAVSFLLSQRAHIENQKIMLSKYKGFLSSAGAYKTKTKQLEGRLYEIGGLRKEDTPAKLAAGIQSQIRRILGNLGGTVLSTVDLPLNDKAPLKRVGVHVVAEGDLSIVVGILAASENENPLLFIDNLGIRAPELIQANSGLTKLTLSFDAYGYVIGGAP